jgi:quinoprotein glucose dehydrogenase
LRASDRLRTHERRRIQLATAKQLRISSHFGFPHHSHCCALLWGECFLDQKFRKSSAYELTMKTPLALALLLGISALNASAEVQVIQAFEGDGFEGWQTTGTAFGLAPVTGKLDGLTGDLKQFAGHSLASSGHGGDAATGTLSSPELTLSQPFIGFLVAGGKHPGKTAVQLEVGGKVVREATGENSTILREVVWGISEFVGRKGIIRIVDNETGNWGVIAADHFVFSSDAHPVFPPKSMPRPDNAELKRVEGEGSAALVPGATLLVSADHAKLGVTSPTAISLGNDGSLYVAETNRFRFGVEDDRSNLFWYLDDLACRTTADRLALHQKWAEKRSKEWMTAKSEKVRLLTQAGADGVFGKSTVFAEHFNDVLDGTAGGVFAWDQTVYFACIPKLWMLRDTTGEGVSTERKVIEDGFGVRISLSGHDMNGFVLGPDGRVWGTIGDRGFNLTTKEGRKYDFHNRGAVFRFEPDGTQFEVVHFGLRNPKELAFDEFGNGISVDNNSDQGDAARIVYVVEGADSGWEMEHQAMHTFHREIGLEKRPPSRWMTERAWELQNPVQPKFLIPPSAYISSGPSGLTYHPGAGFLETEAHHFHICDYRGSAAASGIWSFQMATQGAGMRMVENHKLLWGVAATDIEYDWKGRVVVSDFITGWESHDAGRIVTLAAETPWKAEAASRVSDLIREGFSKRSSDELSVLLRHPDQRVRLRAQLELTRRPDAAERFEVATKASDALERVHGIWGLGILARRGAAIAPDGAWAQGSAPMALLADRVAAAKRLVPLLTHADAEVRAQTVKVLEEAPLEGNALPLGKLILDPSPRVRSFAAIAAGRLGADKFLPEILTMLRENADADPILRHAGVFALERLVHGEDAIARLALDESESVRLAAVIVLRRRGDASVARFLSDASPVVIDEAVRAIHDLALEPARPAVAALLDTRTSRVWTPFMLRRLIHSAFRVGGEQNAARVVGVAADELLPADVRTEALRLLGLWTTPPPVDQSTGHWAPLPARDVRELAPVLSAALPRLLAGGSDNLRQTLELVERYHLDGSSLPEAALLELVANKSLGGAARAKALELWLERKPQSAIPTLKLYATDAQDAVALVALGELSNLDATQGLAELTKVLKTGSATLRQGAWKIIGTLGVPSVSDLVVSQLEELLAKQGVAPDALELLEAAAQRPEPRVKDSLAKVKASLAGAADPLVKWLPALEGGDSQRGYSLFQTHPAGQCLRCHRASTGAHAAGGEAGPNLAGVAKRGDRRYLLESVVYSSAVVVSGYGTVSLELSNGAALAGTLLDEKPDHVDVDISGNRWRILRKDIKSMTPPVSAMPAMDTLLSQHEVRDLVAWLATLDKGEPPAKFAEPKLLDISTVRPANAPSIVKDIDPAVLALGKQQFTLCMACHGPNAEGTVLAPPLAKSNWVNGPADNLIRIQLRGLQGRITVSGKEYAPPVPMPAQAMQTDEQIAAVLTYVRSHFGNSAPPVKPEQVKALRLEANHPPLTPADLVVEP